MSDLWVNVRGVVVPGHRVASQASAHYPAGTIAMQTPFFQRLGLDLTPFYSGTLNISIHPRTFRLVQPEHTFRQVHWTDQHPPEDFSFARCLLLYQQQRYEAWLYYPHPETKERHFQNPSILEMITVPIPTIRYHAAVELALNPQTIAVDERAT